MATFPSLHSGAVIQYPAASGANQPTQVIPFLDGCDQRYLRRGRALRIWAVRLDLLSDSEVGQLQAFFAAQQADYATFTFPDPFTGSNVDNCRFALGTMTTQYTGVSDASTSLIVIETNG
jgi:hypothetical protein